jgi:alanine racemase
MADHIGTISYEVFTRISERVPRLYTGKAAEPIAADSI